MDETMATTRGCPDLVKVTGMSGEPLCEFLIEPDCTVHELKKRIESITLAPVVEQQLTSSDVILDDDAVLVSQIGLECPYAVSMVVPAWTDEAIKAKIEKLQVSISNLNPEAVEADL